MNRILFWPHGYRKKLASAAKISPAYFSDILVRRRGVGAALAKRLAAASAKVLGFEIPAEIWQNNKISTHPAFSNEKYNSSKR